MVGNSSLNAGMVQVESLDVLITLLQSDFAINKGVYEFVQVGFLSVMNELKESWGSRPSSQYGNWLLCTLFGNHLCNSGRTAGGAKIVCACRMCAAESRRTP
jgi:hypothetical protein